MQIILYDEKTGEVKEAINDARDIVVSGKKITWSGGKLAGIKVAFLILADDVKVPEKITSELAVKDRSVDCVDPKEQRFLFLEDAVRELEGRVEERETVRDGELVDN